MVGRRELSLSPGKNEEVEKLQRRGKQLTQAQVSAVRIWTPLLKISPGVTMLLDTALLRDVNFLRVRAKLIC